MAKRSRGFEASVELETGGGSSGRESEGLPAFRSLQVTV